MDEFQRDDDDDVLNVELRADTTEFRKQLTDAAKFGRSFASNLSSAFASVVVRGRSLGDTLQSLALRLSQLTLKAAFKPLENALSSTVSGLFGGITPFANGGVVRQALPVPFAKGGVVASPVSFPLAQGRLGLMGERGAEAILPLSRGPDGRLGVRAEGNGGVTITFNVTATDAASFQRSETQIAAMLNRVVARGERNL